MVTALEHGLVTPTERDVEQIKALQEFLQREPSRCAQIVVPDGEKQDIPAPIYDALRQIVPLMAQGATIALVPLHKELTTQEAADLLNISRPSLIKLLDAGEIPCHRLEGGTHRRLRFSDVMDYRRRRSETRRAALTEIAAIGQAHGAYGPDADDPLFGVHIDEDASTASAS